MVKMNFLEKTIKEYEKNLPFDGQFSPPPWGEGMGGRVECNF